MRPRGKADRIARARMNVAARLCLVFAVLALGSCDSSKNGGVGRNQEVSTTLSISAYSQARIRASAGTELQYSFPLLEIYNGSGALVFHGRDAMANAKVLQEFPAVLQNYQPQDQAPRLENVIAQIPDFRAVERKIGGKTKWVLLSVDLQDCEGCGVQEDALRRVKQRFLEQESVDILEIHVLRP